MWAKRMAWLNLEQPLCVAAKESDIRYALDNDLPGVTEAYMNNLQTGGQYAFRRRLFHCVPLMQIASQYYWRSVRTGSDNPRHSISCMLRLLCKPQAKKATLNE